MTRRERAIVARAIELLHTDDGWEPAIRLLLPLAGMRKPAFDAADDPNIKTVSVYELLGRFKGETE